MVRTPSMSKVSASEGVHACSVRGVGRLALVCLLLGVGVSASGQQAHQQGPRLHSSTPTLLDGFGMTVASAGNQVLVGAPHAAGGRGQTGHAFLFERESGTILRAFGPPSPIGDDLFGLSVDLTAHYAVVGSPRGQGRWRRSTGSVSVFDPETGTLLRVLTSPNHTAAVFGHAVAVQGSLLAIGDPGASTATNFDVGEVYLVDVTDGEVRQTFVPSSQAKTGQPNGFGHAVAFLGHTLAVSAPLGGTDPVDHGQVFLFDRESGRLQGVLESPVPQTNEYFGWALAGDAELLVVGALGQGNGQPEAGAVYLYTRTGRFMRTLVAPEPKPGDHFGEAVALLPECIVVGAPGHDAAGVDAGAVFVFDRKTGDLRLKIANPSATGGVADLFGFSLSGEGEAVAVGSPYGDLHAMPDAGLVHQFRLPFSRKGT